MEWISIKDRKPDTMMCVFVCNDKGIMGCTKAIYYPLYDVWKLDDRRGGDNVVLDVTHWIQIPPLPQ